MVTAGQTRPTLGAALAVNGTTLTSSVAEVVSGEAFLASTVGTELAVVWTSQTEVASCVMVTEQRADALLPVESQRRCTGRNCTLLVRSQLVGVSTLLTLGVVTGHTGQTVAYQAICLALPVVQSIVACFTVSAFNCVAGHTVRVGTITMSALTS